MASGGRWLNGARSLHSKGRQEDGAYMRARGGGGVVLMGEGYLREGILLGQREGERLYNTRRCIEP